MELLQALEDSDANHILLHLLRWRDVVVFASTSPRVFVSVSDACQHYRADVSCGRSPHPIPCDPARHPVEQQVASLPVRPSGVSSISKWSLRGPVPPNFKYLNNAIQTFDDAEDLLEGCTCFGGCDNNNTACPCVQLNAAVESGPVPLFECHAGCSCDPACRLRATQKGGRKHTRLRYMGGKGWGAYSVDAIPGGAFVADYTGEVLSVPEARRRVSAYDKDGLNYVLTTQEFFQGGKQVCQTVVDATTCGNVSRFFNHSCEPTLSVFVIRRGSFLRPRLAFFTRDRVEAGSELTYDYGATGSASGTTSHDRHNLSGDYGCPKQLPTRKKPRGNDEPEIVRSPSYGESPSRSCRRLPLGDRDASQPEKAKEKGPQAWTTRGLEGCPGHEEDLMPHGLPVRRKCLCGSRRCRGLLPFNRAVL